MDFLRVNFQLATPFRFRPRVKYVTDRQTDGQTTAINALCPHLMGAGHNKDSLWQDLGTHCTGVNCLLSIFRVAYAHFVCCL